MPSDHDLEDGMEGKKAASPWRIFTLAKPEWPWLVFGLLMLVLSLVPFLLLPVMIGRILDALVTDKSDNQKQEDVEDNVVFLFVVLVLGSMFALVRSFIFNTAGERVVARLRILLFKGIITQEIG
jgi:ABC-type multidrug transport system fused ATPase/permease subunit